MEMPRELQPAIKTLQNVNDNTKYIQVRSIEGQHMSPAPWGQWKCHQKGKGTEKISIHSIEFYSKLPCRLETAKAKAKCEDMTQ